MSEVKYKINPLTRNFNLRRATDYVTKTTRFYETGLFISTVIGTFFIVLWIVNGWTPIFPRIVHGPIDLLWLIAGIFAVAGLIVYLIIYLSFNRVASDSGVAIMGSRGIYCMDIHSVEKECVQMTDEWNVGGRRFKRIKVDRHGALNGVEKWFGYDGYGRDGAYYATQGSVLLEWVNGKWEPYEAFSVEDGLILKQGIKVGEIIQLILKSQDLHADASKITKLLQGEDVMGREKWTETDLIEKIKKGNPYKLIGAHIKFFPHHFIPRWFETIPRELAGTPQNPGPMMLLKHFNINAPILAGEDIAIEQGGVGSPLQSHQLTRYLSQERIIQEQEETIKDLRMFITQLEAAHLNSSLSGPQQSSQSQLGFGGQ